MAKTFDLGRFLAHFIWVAKGTSLHTRAITQSVQAPFRTAQSHVFRFWPTRRALVVGWWRDSGYDEDAALVAALRGYTVNIDFDHDLDPNSEEVQDTIRSQISEQARDLDDEWTLVNMLGVAGDVGQEA